MSGDIEAATIGAEKGAKWVYDCLSHYNDRHFVKKDGSLDMRPVPILISDVIQSYPDMHIYSYQYFSPKDYNSERLDVSLDTYSIHHFDGKWVPNTFYVRMKRMVHNFIKRFFGLKLHNKFVRVIRYIKYR